VTEENEAESRRYHDLFKDLDIVIAGNVNRIVGSLDAKLVAETLLAQRNLEELRARLKALDLDIRPLSHEDIKMLKSEEEQRKSPPFLAELCISFFVPKGSAQALLGDLQEMFQRNVERLGEKQARRKYWMQVIASFGPLFWQWLKRIGIFTVIFDYFRSKFGL
jgi:hypothetical protein